MTTQTTITASALASIFSSFASNLHTYKAADLNQYATKQGLCAIDRHLLAACGQHYNKRIPTCEIRVIRKRFQSYLRTVLNIDDGGDSSGVNAPVTNDGIADKGIENVTDVADNTVVGFKAFRNRSVLNRGRPFPSYEKARQYIRRHITEHIGADNYNNDQRITMPVDDVNRNYPNITALGYAIKKAA